MTERRPSPADTPDDTRSNRTLHYIALVAAVVVIAAIILATR